MATILLAGATGFAGAQALSSLIAHAGVARVISLQRAPLKADNPHKNNPKLREAVLPSEAAWTAYPPELLSELKQATGVVWALGATEFPDAAVAHRVSTDYTLYALNTLLSSGGSAGHVRFVYTSGVATLREQDHSVAPAFEIPVASNPSRRVRGRVENELLAAGDIASAGKSSRKLDLVAIMRPGFIIDASNPPELPAGFPSVDVKELVAAEIELALKGAQAAGSGKLGSGGNDVTRIIENEELVNLGKAALQTK